MAAGSGKVPSLPPPSPKSPPQYPDLYGKRRELAKVQLLEREIGILEEELKFVEGLPPSSQSCKEITDFVVANSDPFILTTKKNKRYCRFWKWLCCGFSCCNISWICCCVCKPKLKKCEKPQCFDCNICTCNSCCKCSMPKCNCCACPSLKCWPKKCCKCNWSCSSCCSVPKCFSCSDCTCKKCSLGCPKCPKVKCSCWCTKKCCCPCFFCC